MEMIDQLTIQAVEDAFGCGYPRDAAAALLIELDGLAAGIEAQTERVIAACRDAGARQVRRAQDEAERQLLWKGRKSAFGAYGRVSPAYMVMDGVIPRTKLPQVLRRVNEIVAAHGLRSATSFTPATATSTRTSSTIPASRVRKRAWSRRAARS